MKFTVARTSDRGEGKPCEGAKMERYRGLTKNWVRWIVEINTLEELIGFCNKHGNIIIYHKDKYEIDRHSIEIYDDYRE